MSAGVRKCESAEVRGLGSADALFEQFDAVADAPGGVQRLRQAILQLAVRGKLVPQNPGDEPASVLLERIAAEKRRLHEAGEIRKPKKLPAITPEELPFEVPEGWEWVRLASVATVDMGNSPPGITYNTTGEGLPLINGPSEFSPDPLGFTVQKQYTSAPTKTCSAGDLLICVRGATTGRTNIAGFDACIGRGVASICAGDIQPYVNRFLISQRERIFSFGSGSTFPSISYRHLADLLVPLPPLPEQRRIVAKVDQLMALCDELEERQRRRVQKRDRLNRAALHRLTTATSDAELGGHWARIRAHFDLLYDAPETVGELRQAILQLAVRGKLVPQDPSDEPASVLVERIAAEKRRLVEAGEIRKPKKLPPITPDEVAFEVPEGWEWVRLGSLIRPDKSISYGVLVPGPDVEEGIPFVRVQDISGRHLPARPSKSIGVEVEGKYARTRLDGGEILISVVGSIGTVAIVPEAWHGANIARALCRIAPAPAVDRDFLRLALRSPELQNYFAEVTRTLAQPTLNVSQLELGLIPLPPFSEQRRIVARVDQLMALCDELEAKLTRARTKSEGLAASVVHHLSAA